MEIVFKMANNFWYCPVTIVNCGKKFPYQCRMCTMSLLTTMKQQELKIKGLQVSDLLNLNGINFPLLQYQKFDA